MVSGNDSNSLPKMDVGDDLQPNEPYPMGDSPASLVVGIGASAGGLEALQQFLTSMSPVSNLAFIVVQHLSPDYKSLLAEILTKNTQMRVVQAENEMPVEANSVYLIPPKNNMVIKDGRLLLQEYVHSGINHPIDIFFNSLAAELKARSIAVILSGTGTDGTNGIKTIKEEGGLVIIQDPLSAKFDGMPRSAISTGLADFVLTPQAIAEEILNFSNYPTVMQDDDFTLFSDEEVLARIYTILMKSSKIDYSHYKKTTIMRRIERRMVVTHKERLTDYVDLINTDEEEAKILGKEILIGVTNFFRDPSYFEKLKQIAIMGILSTTNVRDPVRVWCAGCSTGEEAYSIAILFAEILDELGIRRDVKIFATDVDADTVDFASKGVYSESIIDDVSPERLSRFFSKHNDSYVINKDIRKMIIFAPHNVFQDPPFGRLDLISCRNVMIYFQNILQKSLLAIFHTALKDGGYLFLGKSETPGEYADVFKTVCSLEKIYRHNADGQLPEGAPISYNTPTGIYVSQSRSSDDLHDEHNLYSTENSYLRFLEEYLPPCSVIDDSNNIIHVFGDFGRYLHVPRGQMVHDIFSLISEELSLVVSNALNKARKEHERVTYTDVHVTVNDSVEIIDITLEPILDKRGKETGLTIVMFSNNVDIQRDGYIEKFDIEQTAAQRIIDLERELLDSQDSLKASIGELETVNEELQAANEELLTANEELQSSNEELQSVNEELYTVNAEYQNKLEEVQDMSNDLSNFLSSTMIGILFVDNAMNIRKFTEYVGREFGLMNHDMGRPLQILSHNFESFDIVKDASNVLKSLSPIERNVRASNDRHYMMRISPYRTTDNTIKGLVITIIDSLDAAQDL